MQGGLFGEKGALQHPIVTIFRVIPLKDLVIRETQHLALENLILGCLVGSLLSFDDL